MSSNIEHLGEGNVFKKLDDSLDQFDKILIELKTLHNSKRHDYANENEEFSNFIEASHDADIPVDTGIEYMIGTKQARRRNLKKQNLKPNNESYRDTLRDRAVYSILALMWYDRNTQP